VVEHFAGPAADAVQGQGLVLITAAPDADNKDWDLLSAVLEAGLQAELERRGFDVTQDDKRESLVGEEGIVHGRTVGGRLVLSGTTAAKPTTNLAGKPLATVDSLTPAERSAYQELDDRRSTTQLTPAEHTHWNQLKAKSVFLWLFYVPGPAHGGP
jgi:hypothetical protein